jgi:hypothetical protein
MSGQPVKAKKSTAPKYELQMNESGAMRRVPIGTVAPPPPPRAAIVTAAVTSTAARRPPPPPEEENIVFDDEGQILTGEARAAALAKQQAPNENELVFGNDGELLEGAERNAAVARAAEQNRREREEREAAALATAAAVTARKPRKAPKKVVELSDANDIEKMKLFYRYREKDPLHFVYTAEGNLEIKEGNTAKLPSMVIPLRAFGELRPEELEEIEVKQKEEQTTVEEAYVNKMRDLRLAYDAYNPLVPETVATVVRFNEELRQLSIARNATLYPERWTKVIESIAIREILLHLPHEDRKMGYPVFLFKRYGLSRYDADGHYRQHGEAAPESMEGGGTTVIFITNPEDPKVGHFHPAFEREFVYNETKYASPYQAFETERFKEFDDDSMVKRLLGTRSAKTIRNLVSGDNRKPSFPIKLWEDILEALYTQFKDATENLKETGDARFHMMDRLIGSPEYANALANVRTKLKEQDTDSAPFADTVKQSVISEDEQKKAKVGAIINNFRRG